MRKLLTTTAVALALISSTASADQATLKSIEDAGVTLTKEQSKAFPKEACNVTREEVDNNDIPKGCQSLVDAVAQLVEENAESNTTIQAIITAASTAHPELTEAFINASIATAPDQTALLLALLTELQTTAAGPNPPGLDIARSVANINNNIPTTVGGGGVVSSPN